MSKIMKIKSKLLKAFSLFSVLMIAPVFAQAAAEVTLKGIDGEIIRVFDPLNHEETPLPQNATLYNQSKVDRRWVRVRRPTIVAGGELTMENLEVSLSTSNVRSTPSLSSATRRALMSKPITERFLPNSTAKGKPTYPKPMTASFTFSSCNFILQLALCARNNLERLTVSVPIYPPPHRG